MRYASESVDRLLGHRTEDLLGRDVRELLDDADRRALTSHLERASARPGRPVVTEWALCDTRGELRFGEAILNDLSTDARVSGIVVNVRDITERRGLEAELRRRAYHDELTGLANRALFEDRIRQALARSDRHGGTPAVLFLDLDDFKIVNDSLGHASGDALLRLVAGRVENCVRAEDTIARLGGDEFGILLPDIASTGDALEVADKILTALATPLMVDGHALLVGASVGVALDPAPREDHGDRLQAILRDADIAMYAAKGSGKHRVELFESHLHAPIVARLRLKGDLETALDEGQFVLHYQPVVDLDTGEIVGAEALVRWQHPERGLVSPAEFIPVAEQTGLIVPLGRWVVREALRQARVWRERHPANCPAYVAVNVAGRQLEAPGFVREVADALAGSGIPASMLMIEVTETSLIEDSETNSAKLQGLRDLGVRLAIDDFRDRLFGAELPSPLSDGHPQDRSQLYRRRGGHLRGERPRRGDDQHERQPRPQGGRRGHRARRPVRAPAGAPVRLRPGLPLLTPGAGNCHRRPPCRGADCRRCMTRAAACSAPPQPVQRHFVGH